MDDSLLLRDLATVLRARPWTLADVQACGQRYLPQGAKWWPQHCRDILAAFPERPTVEQLTQYLLAQERPCANDHGGEIFSRPSLADVRATYAYHVSQLRFPTLPALGTIGAWASWFRVPPNVLLWLADWRGTTTDADQRLQHYRYEWRPRASGVPRLLEAPKELLKRIQRQLLHGLLDHVPLHEAAHGFRTGRSIRTHTAPHAGHGIVFKFDLADFFPSFTVPRLLGFFRWLGYPEEVVTLLVGLCTTRTPDAVLATIPPEQHSALGELYTRRHLPQGAPTSPALANACSFRLDQRLAGLAGKLGMNYTRYADDLVFSGAATLARQRRAFTAMVYRIIVDEGLLPNIRKTRVLPASVRQQVTGLVINAKPNARRVEFDTLKAILHNAQRTGLAAQNRTAHPHFVAHLQGRIAFVATVNPTWGTKLQALFAKVVEQERPSAT